MFTALARPMPGEAVSSLETSERGRRTARGGIYNRPNPSPEKCLPVAPTPPPVFIVGWDEAD